MEDSHYSDKFDDQLLNQNIDSRQNSSFPSSSSRTISLELRLGLRTQICPVCITQMGDMPGSRDAYCQNCGYKDPCCE